MKENNRFILILSYVAAILFFVLLRPYFTWSFALNNKVNFYLSAILSLVFFIQRKKLSNHETMLFVFLIFTVGLFSIRAGGNFLGLLTIMFIVLIPFAKDSFYKSVFDHFTSIYCLIVGISLITWILVLMGIAHPVGFLSSLDETKTGIYATYMVYPLCVSQGLDFRFYGPFDEPGVVGTVSALLLFCNRGSLKSFKSIVLLLTGLFSLSLFFYIIVIVYYLLFGVSKHNRNISIIIVLSLFAGLFLLTRNNDIMRTVLWDRFLWDEFENTIAGDDRMGQIGDEAFERIRGTDEYWFGVKDKQAYLSFVEGSSSYKNVIALNGMIFFILYVLFFFLFGLTYKKNWVSFIIYMIVFLATIYQRPGLFSFVWFFMFSYMARLDSMREEQRIQ